MGKRKGDGVTSGTDATESGSMVCRNVWRLFLRWWLCGVLLPWLSVGMVAHVTAVMMCCTVSARYAALCARSGALT
ncbi:hypothetical protein D8910_002795 [Escherichia coli]|nr:hypothetical protein [Escherichia coli]EEW4625471.1 hypothetical protein [Escherichia coli]EGO8690818.1 hypothetical protein [Escherichia coli]